MTITSRLRTPFESLKRCNTNPEISLYRSIVLQAILDTCNEGKHKKNARIRAAAKKWLLGKSEDFVETCARADLDHKTVTQIAKMEIELHDALKKLEMHQKGVDKLTLDAIMKCHADNLSKYYSGT
jgi:hypothetical protein